MRAPAIKRYRMPIGARLQQGQVLLITVLLISAAVGISLFSFIRPRQIDIQNDARTEQALAAARQALINYASGRGPTNRPGELPCPDRNNDGRDNDGVCDTTASRIGRLPWITLQIPDLRDGSGERLWYAVSSNFKANPPVSPLNSNAAGQLTVTGNASANNVVAIVFAAGSAIAGQNRSAGNVNNVAHYLEGENANGDTVFTTAPASGAFNDRLLAITPTLFFPQVEMRVARQLRETLYLHYNAKGYFPPATAYGSVISCTPASQGRIPAVPTSCGGGQTAWYSAPQPWLDPLTDAWNQVLFYAVAPACTDPAAPNCTGAGGFLTVNGVGGIRALLITPGTPYAGQTRPCATINDCLEAPNSTSFPAFTHDTGSTTANDRVIIVSP